MIGHNRGMNLPKNVKHPGFIEMPALVAILNGNKQGGSVNNEQGHRHEGVGDDGFITERLCLGSLG